MKKIKYARLLVILLALAAIGLPAQFVLAQQMYQYEICNIQVDRSPSNLRVTQIAKPNRMRLEWDYAPMNGVNPPLLALERRTGGGAWAELVRGNILQYDDTTFAWGTSYEYRVFVASDSDCLGLPAPPPDAPPESIHHGSYVSGGTPVMISATPVEAAASENQAFDSRYDLRYGNPRYLDFNFGSRVYRGGLFAGYAADPSRVGRSALKFSFSGIPSGSHIWTGTVAAYHLRSFATGTVNVGAQEIDSNWSAGTLVWSNAPTFATPWYVNACSYDSASPASVWRNWYMEYEVAWAATDALPLAVGLSSTDENTAGWAYFAKTQYDGGLGPRALYVYGAPIYPLEVRVVPSVILGGNLGTGTVYLNDAAPAGGALVGLGSSEPAIAAVPANVTVPAGQRSAAFTVSTTSPLGSTPVDISAGYGGLSSTTTILVEP